MKEMQATYYGKPLDSYTKDELIAIIIEMGQLAKSSTRQHIHDLDFLARLK